MLRALNRCLWNGAVFTEHCLQRLRISMDADTDRAATLNDIARIFEKQNLKADAAQLRKEADRLKGLEISNAKATATPDHK